MIKNKKIKSYSGYNLINSNLFNLFNINPTDSDNTNYGKFVSIFSILLCVSFWLVIFTFIINIIWGDVEIRNGENVTLLGPFGDFFAGVINPIFTFFTFFGLILTILLQRIELTATLDELKQATKAHQAQVAASSKQNELTYRQQFESTFFSMLSEHNVLLDKLKHSDVQLFPSYSSNSTFYRHLAQIKDGNNSISSAMKIAEQYKPAFLTQMVYLLSEPPTIKMSLIRLEQYNSYFSSYFIFLYQILKYIDESYDDKKTAKRYTNLLRSLIPDQILKILLINCSHRYYEYKELLTKFEFFEHLTFKVDDKYPISYLDAINHYDIKAFGQNESLSNFIKSCGEAEDKPLKQLIHEFAFRSFVTQYHARRNTLI
ncbi:TPA: putative phage abortive infection protein [Photobacterium damselae]